MVLLVARNAAGPVLGHLVEQSSSLRVLSLCSCSLGDAGAVGVAGGLGRAGAALVRSQGNVRPTGVPSGLRRLLLDNNSIGGRGATALARSLRMPGVALEGLSLASNPLGDTGGCALAVAIGGVPIPGFAGSTEVLDSAQLSHTSPPPPLPLMDLELAHADIGQAGLQAIQNALEMMQSDSEHDEVVSGASDDGVGSGAGDNAAVTVETVSDAMRSETVFEEVVVSRHIETSTGVDVRGGMGNGASANAAGVGGSGGDADHGSGAGGDATGWAGSGSGSGSGGGDESDAGDGGSGVDAGDSNVGVGAAAASLPPDFAQGVLALMQQAWASQRSPERDTPPRSAADTVVASRVAKLEAQVQRLASELFEERQQRQLLEEQVARYESQGSVTPEWRDAVSTRLSNVERALEAAGEYTTRGVVLSAPTTASLRTP